MHLTEDCCITSPPPCFIFVVVVVIHIHICNLRLLLCTYICNLHVWCQVNCLLTSDFFLTICYNTELLWTQSIVSLVLFCFLCFVSVILVMHSKIKCAICEFTQLVVFLIT